MPLKIPKLAIRVGGLKLWYLIPYWKSNKVIDCVWFHNLSKLKKNGEKVQKFCQGEVFINIDSIKNMKSGSKSREKLEKG